MDRDPNCARASPGKHKDTDTAAFTNHRLVFNSKCNDFLFLRLIVCVLQGVLGGLCSGKSALVHRHLTGSYLPLENAEGWFHMSLSINLLCVSVTADN